MPKKSRSSQPSGEPPSISDAAAQLDAAQRGEKDETASLYEASVGLGSEQPTEAPAISNGSPKDVSVTETAGAETDADRPLDANLDAGAKHSQTFTFESHSTAGNAILGHLVERLVNAVPADAAHTAKVKDFAELAELLNQANPANPVDAASLADPANLVKIAERLKHVDISELANRADPAELATPAGATPAAGADTVGAAHTVGAAASANSANPVAPKATQALAFWAVVLGLGAVFTSRVPMLGVVLGAGAVLFAIAALAKKQSKVTVTAALVMGVIGIVGSAMAFATLIEPSDAAQNNAESSAATAMPRVTLGPESVDDGIVIAEQAFGNSDWDATTGWFVLIVNNPSSSAYFTQQFTVTALDAAGNALGESAVLSPLPPGEVAVSGSFFDLKDGHIASLEVTSYPLGDPTGEPPAVVTSSNVTATVDDEITTVTGTISSEASLAHGAVVTVVARDKSGAITGGGDVVVDDLPQGESAPFEVTIFAAMPAGTSYGVYVAPL